MMMIANKHIRWFTLCAGLLLSLHLLGQDFGSSAGSPAREAEADSVTPEPLKDRIFFGGNVGAQFGNQTFVLVSPLVGYKVTDRWSLGTRITYEYIRVKYGTLHYQNHVVGGSLFTRYFVYKDLFAHVEYEILNGDWNDTGKRTNIPSLLVGGGYLFRMGGNAGFGLSILFNLLPSNYSPYNNPVINAGFTIGL